MTKMDDCYSCRYALRDRRGRFQRRCYGYANCDYEPFTGHVEPTPMEKMEELFYGATMSKFISIDECNAYRKAISDCIDILKEEENAIYNDPC